VPRFTALLAAVALLGAGAAAASAQAAEPELPAGLAPEREEPALPAGLEAPSAEPELPPGLEEGGEPELPPGLLGPPDERPELEEALPLALPFELTGFWEARGGARVQEDEHERDASIAETRLQLEADKHIAGVSLRVTADFVFDGLADRHAIDLEIGEGFVDLREANLVFSPADDADVKAGRQILTWGTGDLVFINDLFPKDWNSFFIGRDEEYLKAPSDAVKLSAFTTWANLDVVYTPRFDADRFIDGRRVSFFDSARGRIVGRDAVLQTIRPDSWFDDDEWAGRLYRNLAGYELALYAYDGFWKSPGGNDAATGRATFPKLSAYGASVRGPLGKGIANAELGYYDSRQDRGGDDPSVRNSELRVLLGYEQEIARNLTLGSQYYLERMLDHDAFLRTLPAGAPERDENRHVLTGRLTWLTRQQTVEWSLFVFYSPSDQDAYLRPRVTYDVTDRWTVEAGANVFVGKDDDTFFGQFEDNSNAYVALRYGF
jgi:hypothetical protein